MIERDEIESIVKEAKPNVKAKSRKVYVNNILRVMKKYEDTYDKKITSFHFLDDMENVKKILPEKNSTKKNYIMSLLIILHSSEKYKDLYDKYHDYANEIIKINDEYRTQQKKSDSQKANWVEWSKIEEVLNDLKKDVYHYKIPNKDELNNRDKKILQDYLLLSLYVYQPPRRAVYANMKIITETEYKELDNDQRRENNWLVVNKKTRKKYFILTVFKTEKTQGLSRIEISTKMSKVFNIVLRFLDTGDWLLTNRSEKRMNENTLTKHLVRILSPTGKRISVNLLRHLYASNKSPAKNVDLEKLTAEAQKMGHSIATHIAYIKK